MLDLAGRLGPPAGGPITVLLRPERGPKSGGDFVAGQPAAMSPADGVIRDGHRRFRNDEGADGVERDRTHAGERSVGWHPTIFRLTAATARGRKPR